MDSVRIAVDVGGTFTDIALEHASEMTTAKVLTTPENPEQGVLSGIRSALSEANIAPDEVQILIHGTTLATNALNKVDFPTLGVPIMLIVKSLAFDRFGEFSECIVSVGLSLER